MTVRRVAEVVETANRTLSWGAAALLSAGVAVVIANILARYTAHLSLTWSAELARYLIVWSALLAAAVLVNTRQHLVVDLPWRSISGRTRRLMAIAVEVGCLAFFLLVAFSGSILVWRTAGQVASSISVLPMSVVYSIVPVSGVFMALGTTANLLKTVYDEEEPPA